MISVLVFLSQLALAEEKNCAIKGMDCGACVEMVQDKICNDSFASCDVKVGTVHLKTKDKSAKIDEKALAKALAGTKYSLEKCSQGKTIQ